MSHLWKNLRLLVEAIDMKAQISQMMSSPRFRQLVDLALRERWTTDEKRAAVATLSAMVVHDDPKRQAVYVKAFFHDDGRSPPGDDEPW